MQLPTATVLENPVIPRMTKVAWHLKRDEIQNSRPSESKKEFVHNISNSGYRKQWGRRL